MKSPAAIRLLATLSLLLATACSSSKLIGNPQFPYPLQEQAQVDQIVHMPTGILVQEADMLDMVSQNRIVYVGETHDNPASHRLQLKILQAMAERFPGKIALGMEMFTPAQDDTLAKWSSGNLTEKEFLKEAGWYKVWKGDFEYYRDLLLLARDKNIPVIGLNADKQSVRKVVANKLDELTPEEVELVANMNLDDPYQRGLVEGIYGGHVKSDGMLDGFHRAQTLWDETMANSVVNFLSAEEHKDFRMVVIAGGNHVRYGFGIPRRVFKKLPLSYTLVGGKEIEIPESKKDQLMDVTLPQFPMTPYEFMVFLKYEELENDDVKLGVMLEEKDNQVVVTGVAPQSNAERAGIQKDDVILAIDKEAVNDSFDVVYAIKQKKSGDIGKIDIKRGNDFLSFDVEFEKSDASHHGVKQ